MFLVESTVAPVLLFLPQTASAQATFSIPVPVISVSSASLYQGQSFTIIVTNGVANVPVYLYLQNPNASFRIGGNLLAVSSGDTDASGFWQKTFSTNTTWHAGTYTAWVTINGAKSNQTTFQLIASPTTPTIIISPATANAGDTIQIHLGGLPASATSSGFFFTLTALLTLSRPDGSLVYDKKSIGSVSQNGMVNYSIVTGSSWQIGTYKAQVTLPLTAVNISGSFTLGVGSNIGAVPPTTAQPLTIARTPHATSPLAPFKVGDATTFTSTGPASLFTTNQPYQVHRQIGSSPAFISDSYTTFDLINAGVCNASTGACAVSGNWSAEQFACPAGTTGIQQMTEWYTIAGLTSNKITWYFECSSTTPPSSTPPIGYLDGIGSDGTAHGWALDPDSSSTSISVHFYIDGAAGQGGTYAGSATANLSRPDLNAAGYPGNHGYNFSIPLQWRDGKEHKLYVHGIDLSGDGTKNILLSQVPRNFTLGAGSSIGTASPAAQSLAIARTPATSPLAPFKVGDATTFTSTGPASLFTTNQPYQVHRQIGSLPAFVSDNYTASDLINAGVCNETTGSCSVTGNWSAEQFACPAGTTGIQQMTEWVTVGILTSNNLTWYFGCPDSITNIIPSTPSTPQKSPHIVENFDTLPLCSSNACQGGSISACVANFGSFITHSVANTGPKNICIADSIAYGGSPASGRVLLDTNGTSEVLYTRDDAATRDQTAEVEFKFTALPSDGTHVVLGTHARWYQDGGSSQSYNYGYGVGFGNVGGTTNFFLESFSDGGDTMRAIVPYQVKIGAWYKLRIHAYPDSNTSNTYLVSYEAWEYGIGGWKSVAHGSASYQAPFWLSTSENGGGLLGGVITTGTVVFDQFTLTSNSAVQPITPLSDRPAPTPTTAPMATLTMEREQERVLPDQLISFSGTLDNGVLNAAELAFPQGSSFFIAIPEKTNLDRIEIDGRALGAGEFSLTTGGAKIPFAQNLYTGSHSFRVVLRNVVSLVPQLDRQVSVWVSVIDATSKLLLRGRTASTMVAHLPTEVIGKGTLIAFKNCCAYNDVKNEDGMITPVLFRALGGFSDVDITRGPFFTPNPIPLLPDNIAFTLFPGDASMQRIGLSLKQFSDPLAREFITAEYQYLLGRDPSSEELSRHLPKFTQWRNPITALAEVYNRRPDVREASKVYVGSSFRGLMPSYDKLLEWAATKGWSEEPSLHSYKLQTGYDDVWRLFQQLHEKRQATFDELKQNPYPPLYIGADSFDRLIAMCPTKLLPQAIIEIPDFAKCWADPVKRHAFILWAKDIGWAYNQMIVWYPDLSESWSQSPAKGFLTINSSGPILAQMFGPGKYSEFAAEQQMRYPPAQLYYDLISSQEYASSIQQRFRTNIDSIYRLFFSRPATESDITWVKNKFIGGIASYEFSDSKVFGFDRRWSWINEQWEPNGGLIASNFTYIADEEFLKNSRFITDDVYGIRHIPGEIDAVSSRLIEMIERKKKPELYQGDNFKRIIIGLYRLYLRRNPTDAEIESRRVSGKNFGDIEFSLNQSSEYGKGSAPAAAIRNLYRNYLGRDPSDADIASWTGKSISTVANALGKSAEVRAYAQQHPENAYIFPIKEIKIVKCGFFCSVMKFRLVSLVPFIGPFVSFGQGVSEIGSHAIGKINSIVLNSISRGFNQAGFNGETFVSWVSVARAMAGQAGGVFSMANLFENADPTILDGFRTMARAPQDNTFVAEEPRVPHSGLASVLSAASNYLGAKQSEQPFASSARLAQIDISEHYGGGGAGGFAAPVQKNSQTTQASAVKNIITKKLTRGSRGAEVLLLQKILGGSDLIFLSQYQTGYYGPKTEAAVKRFQKRSGLAPVGFVGPKTRALLNSGQ